MKRILVAAVFALVGAGWAIAQDVTPPAATGGGTTTSGGAATGAATTGGAATTAAGAASFIGLGVAGLAAGMSSGDTNPAHTAATHH